MRFTDLDFKLLDAELERVKAFAAESRASITFPIAQNLEDYAKRPYLQFEENLVIRCQDILGQFTPHRYNLIQRLAASDNGLVHVLDLLECDEALQLDPLWKEKTPCDESLRNLASRINGDFAKYGMPWAVSFCSSFCCFILRFLPDPLAERRRYPRYLGKIFTQYSFSSRNVASQPLRPPDSPVLPNKPPFGYVPLE